MKPKKQRVKQYECDTPKCRKRKDVVQVWIDYTTASEADEPDISRAARLCPDCRANVVSAIEITMS